MTNWKLKLKIFGAVGMLLLSLSMIGVGTFAWFTIGQRARAGDIWAVFDADKYPFEVSYDYGEMLKAGTPDEATWAKDLNISALFWDSEHNQSKVAPLRPVSTADMVHWYIADYDAEGNVSGFTERSLSEIANQPLKIGTDPVLGVEGDIGNNHILYVDMWVRTTNPGKTYGLKLQTARPRKEDGTPLKVDAYGNVWWDENTMLDPDGYKVVESGGEENAYGQRVDKSKKYTVVYGDKLVEEKDASGSYIYGTYVLGKPVAKDGGGFAPPGAENAFNSLRIGIMPITEDGADGFKINGNPLIYEPNANLHLATLDGSRDEYDESTELVYRIYGAGEDKTNSGQPGTEVQKYADAYDKNGNVTYVPLYGNKSYELVDANQARTFTYADGSSYTISYAQQGYSEWDEAKLSALSAGTSPDSSCVKTLGQFPIDETGYPAELPTIANITYGTPQRIRVFFWIEGQDVDCWNQILGSDIIAKFEFTGTDPTIPAVTEPEPEPDPGTDPNP